MKTELKFTYPDYRAIRSESHCIDCTIAETDFDTSHPNPYRISIITSDINRYLKHKTGGRI